MITWIGHILHISGSSLAAYPSKGCCISRFLRDCQAGLLIIYGLVLPGLVGMLGVGVETGTWYVAKRDLQTQADAAAMGGAWQRAFGDLEEIEPAATNEAVRNGFSNEPGATIRVSNPPISGPNAGNTAAVEVVLSRNRDALFSSLFALETVTIDARAVATVVTSGNACALALNTAASAAMNSTGSTTLNAPNCTLASNSRASDAVSFGGSSTLDIQSVWSAGGIAFGSDSNVTLAQPPMSNMWPIDDPYADLPDDAPAGCDVSSNQNITNGASFSPSGGTMTICGSITVNNGAVVDFAPGTYWMKGADLTIHGGTVTCSACSPGGEGVSFIFTTPSNGNVNQIGTVSINGNATVVLNAPSTGDYAGVLFYQDRDAPQGISNKKASLNGGAGTALNGAIYYPKNGVDWSGNVGLQASCTLIVADKVTFIGNSNLSVDDCADQGVELALVQRVVLAE